ncbi:MAG: AAA family ATPase [Planctomycetota bacterium]
MRVKEFSAKNFKRFSQLKITGLPETAKLVVLLGVNGSGKTSVFEGFNYWKRQPGPRVDYHSKFRDDGIQSGHDVIQLNIAFYGPEPSTRAKAVYLRSAYRNEANFRSGTIAVPPSVEDEESSRLELLVSDDRRTQQNYHRIIANTVADIYSNEDLDKQTTKMQMRDAHIGPLRESMRRVFGDLVLQGVGNPQKGGTFLFEKGQSKNFPHVNLSAGEKDAFDLLLDIFLRKDTFTDSVYCIDEPDLHMHTKLQGRLLDELFKLIPGNSQLWIATHSIGMIRKSIDIAQAEPGSVVFLDFSDHDYDREVTITPATVNRNFWKKFLEVAVGDLANLVAPKRVVVCEGRPLGTGGKPSKTEHDAKCFRKIFAEDFLDTDFISVGNSDDVAQDPFKLASALESLIAGLQIIRVIDRDGQNEEEVEAWRKKGVRVLRRRHLESYLLDDEVLVTLCKQHGKPEKLDDLKKARESAFTASKFRDKSSDDAKAAAGEFFNSAKRILEIENAGSNWMAFFSLHMAGALHRDSKVYAELRHDIFGNGGA